MRLECAPLVYLVVFALGLEVVDAVQQLGVVTRRRVGVQRLGARQVTV